MNCQFSLDRIVSRVSLPTRAGNPGTGRTRTPVVAHWWYINPEFALDDDE